MLKKELKKQQAKEKKQVQTKQQTLHDEAKKKKVQEAKKAIITRPKQIDVVKNRQQSLIKLLKDINNDYEKFNKIDINTLDYKSPEHRKIVVMLRDLPIDKQREFIQDFLEQVDQDKEVKSSAFFKDRYDKFHEEKERDIKPWDEKNRVIREFFKSTFSKEELKKDNFDSSSFAKKMKSYPFTQRKFFIDLNTFIPSLPLQQKYVKKFLNQDQLNAGQYLEKFTKQNIDEIKSGIQKQIVTHDDVFGTDDSEEEGEEDGEGESVKQEKPIKEEGEVYQPDFYLAYTYNEEEEVVERGPLIKDDQERVNLFFKELNLELEDDEILKKLEKFKENSNGRIVSFIDRLIEKLSILQIKKYIRQYLEQSTLNYSDYLDVFISGYGMNDGEDVKTKKFLKRLIKVDYEKWDKKISKFEKKEGADYSRRQFVYTLRSYPKDVIKEYINTLGDKNAQKYLIEFITIPAVRMQRIQIAPNIVGEEKVRYIYNNKKVVIPQTRLDEDGNTEVYYTDKKGKEVDKRFVKFSALGELQDLESDVKPLIKSSYVQTIDPRTYVDMFCVIDYQTAPWIGKPIKNIWINTKNTKYLLADIEINDQVIKAETIKIGGKHWYKPSIKFYALLCSRADRKQEKKTFKITLGAEELDFKIMYEIEGEDQENQKNQEDKKYLVQNEKMFKRMRGYFINKNKSKNTIIDNLLDEKLSDKNECIRSEGLKFIKNKTNLPESFCVEIEKEIFDKSTLVASTVREYFDTIVDIVSFFDSVIIKQDNRVFYNHVVDGYFTASGLINLPYEMRMPTIFKNSLISGQEKMKTLKYIEMIKSDYMKILSNDLYGCLHPYESTRTIPDKYVFPDIELKKLDDNEKRNICKNKDIFEDKSKTDFEMYFDSEDGSYYCFPVIDLLQQFEADNFINSETGRDFNKIFIDKIMKQKRSAILLTKEDVEKKLVAPGLLELLLTNINKFKIQLKGEESPQSTSPKSESDSESDSESEPKSVSSSESKSVSSSESKSVSSSESKSVSSSDSVSPKSSFSNSQQKSVSCKHCQKSVQEEDSHKTMIPPDHMFHFCSIECFENNDHHEWPKAKKAKKTKKSKKTKKIRK